MKGTRRFFLMTTLLAALGCRQKTDDANAPQEHAHAAAPLGDPGSVPANALRIPPDMMRDLRVTSMPVEVRSGSNGVTALGELRADETVYAEVGTSVIARVVQLLAAPGERVQVTQPLVMLESIELGKARAEYLQARARARLAGQALARKRALAAERILPQRELQEAEAETSGAQATLAAARAALRALNTSEGELEDEALADGRFLLRTPIAGTVIERNVVNGQMVDPNRPLFRVADLSRLWLVVHAYERDAVRVRPGSEARITFPALPGRTVTGIVRLVGSEVDADSRTIPVRIEVTNSEGDLRLGMSATAWLPLGDAAESVIVVPAAALQRAADGWCVFLPRGEGTFEVRLVGRGRDLGGEVEILSGLRSGETVVADGAFALKAEADKAHGSGPQHAH